MLLTAKESKSSYLKCGPATLSLNWSSREKLWKITPFYLKRVIDAGGGAEPQNLKKKSGEQNSFNFTLLLIIWQKIWHYPHMLIFDWRAITNRPTIIPTMQYHHALTILQDYFFRKKSGWLLLHGHGMIDSGRWIDVQGIARAMTPRHLCVLELSGVKEKHVFEGECARNM